MGRSVWQDKFIIESYNLSKSGMTEVQMSKVMGISLATFRLWEKKKKQFKLALSQGRKECKGTNGTAYNFRDYVYERLPYTLRKTWRQINKLDKKKSGLEKIEAILANRGKTVRQHLFIYAWTSTNFSISQALRKVNLSKATFEKWKKDPIFLSLIEEINWHKKNFFEDHLCKLIAGGDTSATIFANKTYNRDRGYNEKVEVDMNLSGEVDQNIVSVDGLKLPLDVRKELLKCLRSKKEKNSTV